MAGDEGGDRISSDERRAVDATRESYERIPYRTRPWAASRPTHLQTIAKLWGLEARPASRCRMLELGCGNAANLIPLALAHPASDYLGIDLARVHIDAGRSAARRLGIRNLRLEVGSFADLSDELGCFDYIVAHGLISWVPPILQEKLFATCRRLLAPQGVVLITYNTYPGWHLRGGIRDILLHYNRGVDDASERIERARTLLGFLRRTVPQSEAGYRQHVESIEAVARDPEREYYFAHEYLEDANHPFYFRDFVERAAREDLQYLADADHVDTEVEGVSPELHEEVRVLTGDRIEALQLLDFARNRKFRQSLLCAAEADLREEPDFQQVAAMYVASSLQTVAENPDVVSNTPVTFKHPAGRGIEVDQPFVKAALLRFSEDSIQPVVFDRLLAWAYSRIGAASEGDADRRRADTVTLCKLLYEMFLLDMVELSCEPPCWAVAVSEHPEASRLVRLDAVEGRLATTSLRHRLLALDDERVRQVLPLLDGSRDRRALLEELGGEVPGGELDKILSLSALNAVLVS